MNYGGLTTRKLEIMLLLIRGQQVREQTLCNFSDPLPRKKKKKKQQKPKNKKPKKYLVRREDSEVTSPAAQLERKTRLQGLFSKGFKGIQLT